MMVQGKGTRKVNVRDIAAGSFFVCAGAAFILNATKTLDFGNATQMGPGYFPVLLAGILCFLGLAIALQAFRSEWSSVGVIPWRAAFLVGLAPITFATALEPLGLLPALLISIFLASLSSRKVSLGMAVLITVVLTTFCVVIFSYALGLPIPLIGPTILDGAN